MQKCLNEDLTYFYNKFKKHPWILLIIILFVGGGIATLTVSLLCNVKFPCTNDQQIYALMFGMNMCLVTAIFLLLPCLLIGMINCIYYDTIKEPVLPVTRRSPLSSREPRVRSRSNSREKTPPSPKTPVPKHASKSFREFHSEA
jgi:hypothetical protein